MVRTGEKQTVESGAKQRWSSHRVTNINPNPANDRSLVLLSSGCNGHVQRTIWLTALYASPQTVGNRPLHKQPTTYPTNDATSALHIETIRSVTTHRRRLVPTFNHTIPYHVQPITQPVTKINFTSTLLAVDGFV